jgi:hypothetical protein
MTMPTRRMVLRGLGGAALALPFLPSLQGESQAAVPAMPKRFVYVSISCGEQPQNWWPEFPFTFSERPGEVREAPLSQVSGQGGINRVLGPEFDPFLDKLLFLRGLGLIGPAQGGHNPSAPLSGYRVQGGGPTIDQILAYSDAVYPTPPPVRSIHMMTKMGFQAEAGLSIGTDMSAVLADSTPSVSWQRLFGTFVPDDPKAILRRDLEMGVLDRVRGQYDRIVNHPRLSSDDRQRLTAHAELIHDLQQRILATGLNCSPPDEPLTPSMDDDVGLAQVTDLNIQLLTAGLACDRTRVGVLQLCVGTDLRFNHHGWSHDSKFTQQATDELASIHRGYTAELAQLLAALDAVVEDPVSGETLLDNTLVLFSNEDGVAWDVHEGGAMPALLAGGRFYLNTGRYIDYRQYDMVNGQPQYKEFIHPAYGPLNGGMLDYRGRVFNSLLLNILEAMGESLPTDGFGDLTENIDNQYDEAGMRQPLPYLTG